MSDRSDWIYCRLVDRGTFIFPRRPFWFGQIEFSDKEKEDPSCVGAMAQSMREFAVSDAGGGWDRLVRARLLIPEVNAEEAQRAAAFHLAETLQAFNAHLMFGMAKLESTQAGYLCDIRSRRVGALLPPWQGTNHFGTSMILDEIAHHPQHVLNTLFVAPAAYGELGNAFRRSSHWRDLAEKAADQGEALLLYWMAAECLCKRSHDEPILPKLMAACGFPTGKIAQSIDAKLAREVSRIPRHRSWRGQLSTLFNTLRIARNQIVHAGYRYVDLPSLLSDEQRDLGMRTLPFVAKNLADMALQALNARKTSLRELWDAYDHFLEPRGLVLHARWAIERLENSDGARGPLDQSL